VTGMFHLLGLVLMAQQAGLPSNINCALDRRRHNGLPEPPERAALQAAHQKRAGCDAADHPHDSPRDSRASHARQQPTSS